jgi:hypothetical protein
MGWVDALTLVDINWRKSTIKTFRRKDGGKLILDTYGDASNNHMQEMCEKIKALEPENLVEINDVRA